MALQGKTIILGLTGGIACYKSAELLRLLTKSGAKVHVAMTQSATQFITPMTMQALSGNAVHTSLWNSGEALEANNAMAHINLSRHADAIVIAPASTNFLAKLANGLCDDLLSTLCIARTCPLLVAPAMNTQMWEAPATQRNVQQLRTDGISILGPDAGVQACGETGLGRMLEPETLLEEVIAFFQAKVLQGKRVLITAGPTFEPIDPVRGITNLSSGKMGFAIARAAREAGAIVNLISGPSAEATPYQVKRQNVQTAQQMYDAVHAQVEQADIFIAVAAVADWRVANASEQKLKKTETQTTPNLVFAENPDILASVAALPHAPFCVGFAAESEELEKFGAAKRIKKNVPLLVGNIGHATFGKDENELMLFDAQGVSKIPKADKLTLARQLVNEISKRAN